MDALVLSIVAFLLVLYLWIASTGRKLKARIARIRKIHGPDASICYMNLRGKRSTLQITIESIRPHGRDWVVTAWCYEKKEFVVFCASRMYKYFDLIQHEEITNVQDYFSKRFKALSTPHPEEVIHKN